jgi:hypothetical protein
MVIRVEKEQFGGCKLQEIAFKVGESSLQTPRK